MRANRSNSPISLGLPRQIYWIIIGLVIWLVISVWGFAGTGYSSLVLTVVSLFLVVAVGLPLLLGLIATRHPRRCEAEPEKGSLREWLNHEFDAESGPMSARVAAVQVLLPIAAVSFGMTIFALVHHFDIGA